MSTSKPTIDFSAKYSWSGYPGVAFHVTGWKQNWVPDQMQIEDEDGDEIWIEDPTNGDWFDDDEVVIGIMVGDDYKHEISADELTLLDDGEFCVECGQTGCMHGRSVEDD